ncbi:elicitor-responsive protein 3-like isoform X2 [Primulina huaijiensis]|uniref:elicitor-responsive protein 3-like isoform X2 n=1 Tax=Primulina huaijiensis TaxID=1492673 RepID=UPI003CC71E5E
MSVSGIHGQLLEITVVGCNKLRNTEWISRQDPYVCLDYASSKHRTRTCYGGGKNPTFQDKFDITLIEGLLDINITVWNSNKLTFDDFIGNGEVPFQGVLCQGYVDSCWPLQDRKGRNAGEVRLVMHYPNAKKLTTTYGPSAPQYAATPLHPALYSAPPRLSSHPLVMANYPPPVPPPCPQPLYYHQPSPYHPAYQASPSYPQQPAYPPALPNVPQYYYPQDTYPPPPHPRHHMF